MPDGQAPGTFGLWTPLDNDLIERRSGGGQVATHTYEGAHE